MIVLIAEIQYMAKGRKGLFWVTLEKTHITQQEGLGGHGTEKAMANHVLSTAKTVRK